MTVTEFDCATGETRIRPETAEEAASREAAAAAYAAEQAEAQANEAAAHTVRAWLDAQIADPTVRAALARLVGAASG